MNKFKAIVAKWTIPFILLISVWYSSNIHWGKQWNSIITSDGKGYYAYLPATFIYHDLNFGFFDSIETKYYTAQLKYDFRSSSKEGKIIDKYFSGVAVLQLPFFLGGHAVAKLSGAEADGYSKPYAIALNIGACFWLLIGLIFLRRLLISFGASHLKAALVLLTFVFGTNLFYYVISEPAMSHVYSFSLISIFLVYSKKWLDTLRNKYFLLMCLLLGIITLVRPVNLLIVLWIPFAAGSSKIFFSVIQANFRKPLCLVTGILLFFFPILIQLVIYKTSTGHWYIYAYGIEHFYFWKPELINFLFSYKKGLFIYTPLTFLALFGLIPLWKKDRFRAIWMGFTIFFIMYVLSCWWMWYYGGSFGMRPMVDFFSLFALLWYFLFESMNSKTKKLVLLTITFFLIAFCQFQTLQYRYEIIHWSEMTKESYWHAFLNFDFLLKKFH